MPTTVSDYTALLSGESWWGDYAERTPVFLTYSFETEPYDYLSGLFYTAEYRDSFKELTAAEKQQALTALARWDKASGVHFLEVPAGQGDIRFGSYDFSRYEYAKDAVAYAMFPDTNLGGSNAYDDEQGGDVYLDWSVANNSASDMLHVLLHEIGHALGLKHPFDGDVVLNPAYDNTLYTVMSYNGYAPSLGGLDVEAIQSLYGPDTAEGVQGSDWSWNAATFTLTQTGTAADDTIRGVSTANVVAGLAGDDRLFGWGGNDRFDGGEGADLIVGQEGDDVLIGGAGDDLLYGGRGRNRLEGGDGNDNLSTNGSGDRLDGGAGNDVVDGGRGDDTLIGGLATTSSTAGRATTCSTAGPATTTSPAATACTTR